MSNEETEGSPRERAGFVTGVSYPEEFLHYAITLCESASRYIDILSPALDHAAFDSAELSSALSALARRSRQTRVRILVQDARNVVSRGHQLLALARRLPSTVHIQVLAEHPDWNGQTVVLRDRDGVLYRPAESDNKGFYEPDSRASTQRHLELFEELWRYSVQDPQLRALHL
ncbi:MAG: hypothetical protein AB8C02_11790 [Halioglobus sp.]